MKKIEMAKQAMQKNVLQLLDDHKSLWEPFTPFAPEVAALRSIVAGIDKASGSQTETDSEGYTSQKNRSIDDMLEATYRLALKMKAWAKKEKNEVVLAAVNLSRTRLTADTDAEQIARCRLVVSKAEENLTSLATYEVTAAMVANVKALVEAAASQSIGKDTAGATHQTATGSIGTQVKNAAAVLDTLDDLVEAFLEEKDPDFASTYFAARKTRIYRGGGKKDDDNNNSPGTGKP